MRVCTLHLAITLGIRRFSREIIKKYASYCIIACVLTWRRRRDSNILKESYGAVLSMGFSTRLQKHLQIPPPAGRCPIWTPLEFREHRIYTASVTDRRAPDLHSLRP